MKVKLTIFSDFIFVQNMLIKEEIRNGTMHSSSQVSSFLQNSSLEC